MQKTSFEMRKMCTGNPELQLQSNFVQGMLQGFFVLMNKFEIKHTEKAKYLQNEKCQFANHFTFHFDGQFHENRPGDL